MSASPSRANLLDVFPEFSDEEERTGIHVRPTLSMPPVPEGVSNTVAALIAESEAEETLEDGTEALDEEIPVELTSAEPIAVQASLPPAPEGPVAPPPASSLRRGLRMGRLAFTIAVVGFAVGFFFTSPAPHDPPSSTSPAEGSFTARALSASETVEAPSVSIAPAVVAAAPLPSAEPAVAPKPPPTLADGDWMLRAGNLGRAEQIYQSVLARGGADHEALTGLGKVALARGQANDALAFFERAVARQPEFLPARLGVADALWDAGRKDAAKARYAAIRERYASSMVPARAIERTR